MRLFPRKSLKLNLPNSDIRYYPGFFTIEEADHFLRIFKTGVLWQQDDIKVFGKVYPQPRLTALYGNNERSYSYSNLTMEPHPFTEDLLSIKKRLNSVTKVDFTSCLLNLYRNGKDSNGWHADDEKELGEHPVIASVSLGQERFFHLRHKINKQLKHKILLEHGSLLLMAGETQHFWQHQIPKTSKSIGERINLTFRVIQ
ncbi:MAG: alpha-ketoglutarate-dependent dioxygenase AlkB [Eudoraea sp.]|nr:alpha-ketoglutarate-dependent dioxygenase AlkB [Eudoraea sp.]